MHIYLAHSKQRLAVLGLLVWLTFSLAYAQKPAGTTADRATAINEPTELTVQSGGNFVRITADHLPATILYTPTVSFGAVPVALYAGDTIESQRLFSDCKMAWKWAIAASEESAIIEVRAHESALITVQPKMCRSDEDTIAVVWDSITWRGTTYTTDGDYPVVLTAPEGCDYTLTLKLTVHHTLYDTLLISSCDSFLYSYNGKKYTESGLYLIDTTKVGEDRQVNYIDLTIHRSCQIQLDDIAECESFVWGDTTIYDSDTYTRRFHTQHGCDSIVTRKVTILEPTYGTDKITAYEEYKWLNGTTYTASIAGPIGYLTNVAGCDSIVTLDLTIRHLVKDTLRETICSDAAPFIWRGQSYSQSINLTTDTLKGTDTDTLHTLELTVHQAYAIDTFATACNSFTWRGDLYSESGDYPYNGHTQAGCDSIVMLHLTISQSLTSETTEEACNSFTWNGETYSTSGDYTYSTTAVAGCDSTAILHLTIHTPTTGEETVEACVSYTWNGETYTESGDYTYPTTNVAGCDSTAILHLTIYEPTQGDTIATACSKFVWYGTEYETSGDYKHTLTGANEHGCDSILTLHLTVYEPTQGDTTATACSKFVWYGTEYETSGEYEHTLTGANEHGCDSILTLHLTVIQPTSGEVEVTECDSYTSPQGNKYTETGDYIEHTTNIAGCDSVITLHVTILSDCGNYGYDTIYFCPGLNTRHDERVSDELVRRYLPYRYESPDRIEFLEGVLVEQRADSTLLDFHRAEINLRNYYVADLTPVDRVLWSVQYRGTKEYVILEVKNEPQWVAAGRMAVQVQFLCGEVYYNAFSTEDIESIELSERPTKRLVNGQILIFRGEGVYTMDGKKLN